MTPPCKYSFKCITVMETGILDSVVQYKQHPAKARALSSLTFVYLFHFLHQSSTPFLRPVMKNVVIRNTTRLFKFMVNAFRWRNEKDAVKCGFILTYNVASKYTFATSSFGKNSDSFINQGELYRFQCLRRSQGSPRLRYVQCLTH